MVENKIAAGIITFNPDVERLTKNLNAVKNQVDKIYIFDNGSSNINELIEIVKEFKIDLYTKGKNLGIAYGLNYLCNKAIEEGFEWILTLDQDSIVGSRMVEKLSEFRSSDIAIISPSIVYEDNEEYSEHLKGSSPIEVNWTITSGSLTNLIIWKKIGKFDDCLFIDRVDEDYCKRALKKNKKIFKIKEAQLYQQLGNLNCKNIMGRTVYVTHYSPFRLFFQTRNTIILYKKNLLQHPLKEILKMYSKVLLFEDQKLLKTMVLYKGLKEGINYKETSD